MNPHSLLGTIALLLFPATLASQDSLPSRLQQLKQGQRVRLLTLNGYRVEGPIEAIASSPPVFRFGVPDSAIPVGTIDSLWLRRTHAGKGAWIGALILGIPSAVFWTGFCDAVSEGQGCDALDVVAGLTLAGAVVGAGVGALIGSTSARWELRYVHAPVPSGWARPPETRIQVGLRLRLP